MEKLAAERAELQRIDQDIDRRAREQGHSRST